MLKKAFKFYKQILVVFSVFMLATVLFSTERWLSLALYFVLFCGIAVYVSYRRDISIPFISPALKRAYFEAKFRVMEVQNRNINGSVHGDPVSISLESLYGIHHIGLKDKLLLYVFLAYARLLYYLVLLFKGSEESFVVLREELSETYKNKVSFFDEERRELVDIEKVKKSLERGQRVDIKVLERLYAKLYDLYLQKQRKLKFLSSMSMIMVIASTVASTLILNLMSPHIGDIKAASFGWTQNDWSGGATANTADHANNQTGWNQFSSPLGYALSFDGADDYAQAQFIPTLESADDITVEATIYITAISPTNYQGIIFKDDSYYKGSFFLHNDGRLEFSGSNYYVKTADPLETGRWYHIVGTVGLSSPTPKIYIDGVLQAESGHNNLTRWYEDVGAFKFGWNNQDNSKFNGLIDEVAVYDRILSEEAIFSHYNGGNIRRGLPSDEGLIAGWHFDENTGTSTADYSGHGAGAVLYNGTAWTNGRVRYDFGSRIGLLAIASSTYQTSDADFNAGTFDKLVASGTGAGASIIIYDYNDEFGSATQQDIKSGGDGAKQNGWHVLNTDNASAIDTDISNTGKLTISCNAVNSAIWQGDFTGPFVYKNLTGDFDVETIIDSNVANNYEQSHLLVRDPNASSGEDWLYMENLVMDGVVYKRAMNTVNSVYDQIYEASNDNYFRIKRAGNIFTLYSKASSSDPWIQYAQYTRDDFSSSVQVGLAASAQNTSGTLVVKFDYFKELSLFDNGIFESGTIDLGQAANISSLNFSASSTDYQSVISSEPGLVSYWKMDNDWQDASSTNHGTAIGSGISFGPAKFGDNAATLDGTLQSYVSLPDDSIFSGLVTHDFSAEAWVKLAEDYSGWGDILVMLDPNQDDQWTFYISNSGKVAFYAPAGSPGINFIGNTVLQTDVWYHVAVVREATSLSLYVNGSLDSSIAYNSNPNITGSKRVIGGNGLDWGEEFEGSLDEIAVYNTALSAADILAHYNAGEVKFQLAANSDNATWDYAGPDGTSDTYYTSSGQSFRSTTTMPAPAALWDMDGDWNDGIGINDCSAEGSPVFASGKIGTSSAQFDSGDGLVCGNNSNLDMTVAVSVEAWVKVENTPGNWVFIASKYDADWMDSGFGLVYNGSAQRALFGINNAGGGNEAWVSLPQDNTWHHLVGTYDGTTIRIYKDGVEGTPFAYSQAITPNSEPFAIGGRTGVSDNFPGSIDEVAVYDHALSAAEVSALYHPNNRPYRYARYKAFFSAGGISPELKDVTLNYENFDISPWTLVSTAYDTGDPLNVVNKVAWTGTDGLNYQEMVASTTGLVSYWKMDGDWSDSRGTNDGVASGTVFSTAKYGTNSGSFDGVDDLIEIPHDNSLNFNLGDFTMTVWVKTSYQSDQTIMAKYEPGVGGGPDGWEWDVQGSTIGIYNYGDLNCDGTAVVNDGVWHFIAVSVDNDSGLCTLWVDGLPISQDPAPTVPYDNNGPLRIGTYNNDIPAEPSWNFNGLIDEVTIYNRALTAEEMLSHYNNGVSANFQIRTSPDGLAWTDWLGPTGVNDFYTTSAGSENINPLHADGIDDRWIQYKTVLASDGFRSPAVSSVTISYGNHKPEIQNVSASEATDGSNLVTVNYEVRDKNTDTGVTPGVLDISLEFYDGSSWVAAATVSGDVGAAVSVTGDSWTPHSLVWDAKTDRPGAYDANFQVRVKADDGETVDNSGYGESAAFAFDTLEPQLSWNPWIDAAASSSPIFRSPVTDHSAIQLKTSLLPDLSDAGWQTPAEADQQADILNAANLVSYWKLDNDLSDSKGSLPGSDNGGAAFGAEKIGSASLSLDGVDDFVSVTSSPTLGTSDFSFEWWMKMPANSPGVNAMVAGDTDMTFLFAAQDNGDGTNRLGVYVPGEWGIAGGTNLADNNWHHIVISVKNGMLKAYIDDWEELTVNGVGDIGPTDWLFGRHTSGETPYGYYNGQLDEIAYYDRALSASEVRSRFRTINAKISSLNASIGSNEVYSQYRDAFGNVSAIFSASIPQTPTTLIIRDLSNLQDATFQEFVAWRAAADPPAGFYSYQIWLSTDDSDYRLVDSIASRATNYYFHTGLSSTTNYYYKVSMEDMNGNTSFPSSAVSDLPDGQGGTDMTPPTITNVRVVSTTTQSVIIEWETDELSDSTVGYSLGTTTFASEVGAATMVDNASGIGKHSVAVISLTPGATYYFQVKSSDPTGNETVNNNGGSGFSFSTVAGPVISNVAISEVSNAGAVIEWNTDIPADCHVSYSTSPSLSNPSEASMDDLVTAHTIALDNLTPGQKYYFTVRSGVATDNNGGQYYSFTTTYDSSAPAISALAASFISDTSAVIEWDTNEKATSRIQFGLAPGSYTILTPVNTSLNLDHTVTLAGLTANTAYYYQAISQDASGNAATSSEASFRTLEVLSTETEVQSREETIRRSLTGGYLYIITDKDATIKTDNKAPVISDISVSDLKSTSAVLNWKTDEAGDSLVDYGKKIGYDLLAGQRKRENDHKVILNYLYPGTTYHYRVTSQDAAGNLGFSDDKTFTTPVLSEAEEAELKQLEALEADERPESAIESISQKAMRIISDMASNVPSNVLESTLLAQFSALAKMGSILPAPAITEGPKVSTTATGATVNWRTDKSGNSLVSIASESSYAVNKDYSQTIGDPDDNADEHIVNISDLEPDTTYHYQTVTKPLVGGIVRSGDLTFKTKNREIEITSYSVENISNEKAVLKWATNKEGDSAVHYIPYRHNTLAVDEAKIKTQDVLTTMHEIAIDDFEAGTIYEVELQSKDAKGNITTRRIQTFSTSKDDLPPLITNVQTESALTPGQNVKVQTIISWKTNEPATSRVYFQKGFGGNLDDLSEKTAFNGNFTRDHVVVLTKFEPGSVYRFRVESSDYGGNSSLSKVYTILVPQQKETVFQVIMKNFESIFGWMGQAGR